MKLTNNRYEVTFTAKGGEIKSFTDLETGIQYMWQGHPDYWTGKNPGLFPPQRGCMYNLWIHNTLKYPDCIFS